MVWDANLVKETVQLTDDGVDLLGQVTGVHLGGMRSRCEVTILVIMMSIMIRDSSASKHGSR